ncbi:MAG TPA: hypothetical protein PKE32_04680 [Miltoncostaeaceae bacterium]|nr:hypothetical protein [Miltoncostaeaceae bacterium]
MMTFAAIIAAAMVLGGLLFALLFATAIWAAIGALRPELLRKERARTTDDA